MIRTKIISAFAFSLLWPALCVNAQDALADKSWYDDGKKEFSLSTPAQLKGLAELVNAGYDFSGKTVYLHGDVNLADDTWLPIGTVDTPFAGTFDGSGFNVDLGRVAATTYGGFFGVVGNGKVHNLNVTVQDTQKSVGNFGAVAGLAGEQSDIAFCNSRGQLSTLDAEVVGGIVGLSRGNVSSCANYCAVRNANAKPSVTAGVVGRNYGNVTKCINVATVAGSGVCAGVVGQCESGGKKMDVSGSCNLGHVSALGVSGMHEAVSGGIGGKVENVTLEQCYNAGTVDTYGYKQERDGGSFRSYAGGLVGYGEGDIKYSYNVGGVSSRAVSSVSEDLESLAYSYAAGLIGYLSGKNLSSIAYSYNAGQVYNFGKSNSRSYINSGGVLGDFDAFMPTLICCYYLGDAVKVDVDKAGINDVFTKDVGQKVTREELSSADFLHSGRGVKGLNDDEVFAYDENLTNGGFPVCPVVQTLGLTRTQGGVKALLKGVTNTSCVARGFYYWYGGFEEYAVEQPANSDFESTIEMPKKGEDLYVQSYVLLNDGNVKKGNVQKLHVPSL